MKPHIEVVRVALARNGLARWALQLGCLATGLLLLSCDKTPLATPKPRVLEGPSVSASASSQAADASLPNAASVVVPATPTAADPTAGRTNSALTRTQESNAMPLPGQNNDHSAPLSPAKPTRPTSSP